MCKEIEGGTHYIRSCFGPYPVAQSMTVMDTMEIKLMKLLPVPTYQYEVAKAGLSDLYRKK